MKSLFPEFEPPGAKDYKKLWSEALFVFDTNVLLNLYRYRESTRDELLSVLKNLGDRLWIPHHVALEFQKNRLTVIADQNKRFSDVKKAIETSRSSLEKGLQSLQLKERHALIDPDELLTGVTSVIEGFLRALAQLEAAQQTLTGADPLKSSVEEIFHQRVGSPPTDQPALDLIYAEAEKRYERGMPPGFRDDGKDDDHRYRGLLYKPRYGDVLVWKQILAHFKAESVKCLIFVTDDNKDDWWRKIPTASGPQTIGPRIELMEEALLAANIESVLFYRPAAFLKNAKEFISGTVSQESIDEIQNISIERIGEQRRTRKTRAIVELAVSNWAMSNFDTVQDGEGFVDLIGILNEETYALDIRTTSSRFASALENLQEAIDFIRMETGYTPYDHYVLIYPSFEDDVTPEIKAAIDAVTKKIQLAKIKLSFGRIDRKIDGATTYIPQYVVSG